MLTRMVSINIHTYIQNLNAINARRKFFMPYDIMLEVVQGRGVREEVGYRDVPE